MPLPQLNTQGIDITNTLMRMQQMDSARAQDEDRRIAAGQRNSLYELQKRKADYEMSPENLKTQRDIQNADLGYKNALTKEHWMKAAEDATKQIVTRMQKIPLTPELLEYEAFYNEATAHPQLGEDAKAVLLNPKEWLKEDRRYPSGYSIPEGDVEKFKKAYTAITNSIAKQIKPSDMVKIQVPGQDGKFRTVAVGKTLYDGQVLDPEELFGPGARMLDDNKDDKGPEVKTFTVGDKEIQKQYNPTTKAWESIPGVEGGPRFKDTPEKDAGVFGTYVNKNGEFITQMKDNKFWKKVGDKDVPATAEDLKDARRVADAPNPALQQALEGMNAGEEGVGTGSSVGDAIKGWVKEKADSAGAAWNKKPSEVNTASDAVNMPTGVTVEKPKVATPSNPVKVGAVKEVKSKSEWDALPAGSVYTYNGVKYRKQ